ncbi:MAG: SPFH domain-containing protein [Buchnera aphidicola (Eriosoma harunire)]
MSINKFFFMFFCTICVCLFSSIFIVEEGKRVILCRLDHPIIHHKNKTTVYLPGIHIKIPYLESIKTFDARIQSIDNKNQWFHTKDKKSICISSYIQWKIVNFNQYYISHISNSSKQLELFLVHWLNHALCNFIISLNFNEINSHVLNSFLLKNKIYSSSLLKNHQVKGDNSTKKNNIGSNSLFRVVDHIHAISSLDTFKKNYNKLLGIKILNIKISGIMVNEENMSKEYFYINDRYKKNIYSNYFYGFKISKKIRSLVHAQANEIISSVKREVIRLKRKIDKMYCLM